MNNPLRVGIAYPAFFGSFAKFFPGLTVIKSTQEIRNLDLVIFSGGEDINPGLYGRKQTYTSYFSEDRDRTEVGIFNEARRRETKTLGVCRGHQLINACMGGTLFQDIYLEAGASHPGDHKYDIEVNSPVLKSIPPIINSLHHQGIERHASGLIRLASYKGIPEVCASLDNKIITVQFHPEFMELVSFFNFIKEWVGDTSSRLSFSPVSSRKMTPKETKLMEDVDLNPVPSRIGRSNPVRDLPVDREEPEEEREEEEEENEPEEEQG